MAFLIFIFSAFSSVSHFLEARTSCLLVNLRLNIWSSSLLSAEENIIGIGTGYLECEEGKWV